MSRRTAGWILAAAVGVLVVAGFVFWGGGPAGDTDGSQAVSAVDPTLPTFEARLFYPDAGGLLRESPVTLQEPSATRGAEATERMRVLLQRYLEGPAPEGTHTAFPPGTVVQSIDRAADGIVFVSLSLAEGETLQVGSRAELMMVYGLVNSLALSFEEVERVALLWTGVQPPTFAGHVDTTRPLPPSRRWVRATSS